MRPVRVMAGLVPAIRVSEYDPEKWKSVFLATNATRLRGDHAQSKRWDHDAIPCNRIMI
jgi:hypothetical protein